ncbi:mechanosensitive ion channel domain-containing protein [Hyphobacterium sp. HN65]|uniref:Mechanosensitive ion channel domain-containing protein n=1 Tax=Hyphobacterium lacteum TaxID=3116575 RepID=A0ABU7LRG4_9PROT|nr:mechanosensitive ion channel domain-containing protein [Hyphobacterium sp. HN65]MEE2526470.1 mechanosensitive ion channel domain-containing protein [Hyphobacterium sp. HN65]
MVSNSPPGEVITPDLEELADPAIWRGRLVELWEWLQSALVSVDFGVQIAALLAAAGLAFALRKPLAKIIDQVFSFGFLKRIRGDAVRFLTPVLGPAMAWIFLSAVLFTLQQLEMDFFWVRLGTNLVGAWAIIRSISGFISEPFWSRTIAISGWAIAAMNILGWLEPTTNFLSSLGMSVGGGRVSVMSTIQALVLLVVLYWLASRAAAILSSRINKLPSLNPSARLLIGKSVQVTLLASAVLLALSSLGIPLGALAIFSGAVGLGIGFGLQKIFSNLVSGVILLLDRSIKPGDVITLEDTYGRVNSLGMRFASVITRDGMEHLIPNEEFITTKVINWSFSDHAVRIKRPIGVDYSTDVPRAIELAIEACSTVPRVLGSPAPKCLLRGFGDNSIDLEIRFWIADPGQGVNNVASDVLLAVWKSFADNGVAFPFPQRDIHFKGGHPIDVRVTKD